MKRDYTIYKIFAGYLLVLLFLMTPSTVNAQSYICDEENDICVVEFNASWNAANSVDWINELTDCGVKEIDIAASKAAAEEYKIVIVPTIIIYNDGHEVKRFQANIMMVMDVTQEEVQETIDEIIMSDF